MDEEYWNGVWEKEERSATNYYAKRAYRYIAKCNYQTLLDVGCGDGRDSLYFAQKGMDVTSIDLSETAIARLKQSIKEQGLTNIRAITMDTKNLNIEKCAFDVIYAHLSLQYFDDDTTSMIFNDLYDILKPEGVFFVRCKSTDDRLCGEGQRVGHDIFIRGHLRHFFSKEYMKDRLIKFNIVQLKKTTSFYPSSYRRYKSSFVEAIATKKPELDK